MEDRREEYDPAKLLTRSAIFFLGVLIIFICGIIALQIWISADHKANTESWAALTGIVGFVTGIMSVVYNARYGISKQSDVQSKTIAKQAETAAVAQAALVTAPLQQPDGDRKS